ncbi:MAG: DUF1330 domain-containing protein [Litoreibacter sp.]
MAKGYWIGHVDVHNLEKYDSYRAANAAPFKTYGAKFLVRGGHQDIREGNARSRTVILEFPSFKDAVACYESSEYQNAKSLRLPVSECDMMIVEGYDP